MRIVLQKKRTFLPEFNKNKTLPPKEQIVVEFEKPNARQRRLLRKNIYQNEGPQEGISFEVITDDEALIKEIPCSLKNYFIAEDGKEREVATLKELYELPGESSKLFTEIVNEIMKEDITADDLKNSASASA